MKAMIESWGLVLAGHWNRMIFNPAWVNANVFHSEESELLLAFPPVATTYRHRQVDFEIHAEKLIFKPLQLTDACLLRAEKMAVDTLGTLTHTPLVGAGLNFVFVESRPSNELVSLFNSADGTSLERNGWTPAERLLHRKLTKDGRILNLSLSSNGHGVSFAFNFNTDTANTMAALHAVTGQHLACRDQALQIMKDIYSLELAAGDDDE